MKSPFIALSFSWMKLFLVLLVTLIGQLQLQMQVAWANCDALLDGHRRSFCYGVGYGLRNLDCVESTRTLNKQKEESLQVCEDMKVMMRHESCTNIKKLGEGYNICVASRQMARYHNCEALKPFDEKYQACLGIAAAYKGKNCLHLSRTRSQMVCLSFRQIWNPKKVQKIINSQVTIPSLTSCTMSRFFSSKVGVPAPVWKDMASLTTIETMFTAIALKYPKLITPENNFSKERLIGRYSDLEKKLALRQHTYQLARERLIERVLNEGKKMGRTEWEDLLKVKVPLTEKEKRKLKRRQEVIIEHQKENHEFLSLIDLQKVRRDKDILVPFCQEMPKGGLLHVHPTGTMSRDTVKRLIQSKNPIINSKEIIERLKERKFDLSLPEENFLAALADYGVANFKDLSEEDRGKFLNLFHFPDEHQHNSFEKFESLFLLGSIIWGGDNPMLDLDKEIYLDFLKRAATQGVSYVEFTEEFNPDDATWEKLQDLANDLTKETGVIPIWNMAFYRQDKAEKNSSKLKKLMLHLDSSSSFAFGGVDLIGNESLDPALESGQGIYIPILAAKTKGFKYRTMRKKVVIPSTIHAGELGKGHLNVRDALIMGVDRIGHGVLMEKDPMLLEWAAQQKIPIETNLTSNLKLGIISDLREHPFLKFLRLGMKVSLSTDDEGMFETDINTECEMVVAQSDINYYELKKMALNSIKTSFAPKELKVKLLQELKERFLSFEAKWIPIVGNHSSLR